MLLDFTLHSFVPKFLRVIKSLGVETHQTTMLLQSGNLNTEYITSSRNTTKFITLCCTICYTTTCFGLF